MDIHELENLLKGDGWQYAISSSDVIDFSLANGEHVILTLLPEGMRCNIKCPTSVLNIVRQKYTSVSFTKSNTILWDCDKLKDFLELCAQCDGGKAMRVVRKAEEEIDSYRNRLQNIAVPERATEQNQRMGQDLLRKYLLAKYGKCQITGIREERLLRVSHIIPWHEGTGPDLVCLDPENVLLLSVAYDALFDAFLISFNAETGRLFKADNIGWETLTKLGVTEEARLDISSKEQACFLNEHNKRVTG